MKPTPSQADLKAERERARLRNRTWTAIVVIARRNDGAKFYQSLPFDAPGISTLRHLSDGESPVACDLQNGMTSLDTFLNCSCEKDARGDDRCAFHRLLRPTDLDPPEELKNKFSDEVDEA